MTASGPSLYRTAAGLLPSGARRRIAAQMQRAAQLSARMSPAGRRSIATLGAMKDRHRGETCVILGNGPSLGGLDLRDLQGVPAFCLNRGYLLWREQGLSPAYYVAVNDLVIEQFAADIAALPCPKFLPLLHRRRFASVASAIFVPVYWDRGFPTDARRGLRPLGTVTVATLQLAYHFGFARVVLLGIDHRFEVDGPPHLEITQAGPDPSHFRGDYFGPGVRWNLPDLARSEIGYRAAKAAFEAAGRTIINATPGTALTIFPTMPLSKALA